MNFSICKPFWKQFFVWIRLIVFNITNNKFSFATFIYFRKIWFPCQQKIFLLSENRLIDSKFFCYLRMQFLLPIIFLSIIFSFDTFFLPSHLVFRYIFFYKYFLSINNVFRLIFCFDWLNSFIFCHPYVWKVAAVV